MMTVMTLVSIYHRLRTTRWRGTCSARVSCSPTRFDITSSAFDVCCRYLSVLDGNGISLFCFLLWMIYHEWDIVLNILTTRLHACIHTCTDNHMYTDTQTHKHVLKHTHTACMLAYTHAQTTTCTQTYRHTHKHVLKHTHTHPTPYILLLLIELFHALASRNTHGLDIIARKCPQSM